MAKPVLKINTTKPAGTPKGAGNKRGLPVVATKPPVTRPSRLSNSNTNSHAKTNTPAKTSNKRLLVEEDDEDDDDDCDNPSATSALTPNNFPTLEEYKTHVRLWHNRIGRKYRNKLNEQFESLLAVLQLEEAHRAASTGRKNNDSSSLQGVVIQGSKKHTTTARGRAVNKAKLLDMARQRIEEMMEERSSWMEEREELHSRLQHSIGTWRQQQ
ncbi:hypothetical protein QBC35DRAFT_395941 [Podospora australis]|uniref:Uncharacterized protein n=1 Tax=Podospora australis TaxID=1536484 RepID=A0AAN7ADX4_9PEZI|nr:hypothetical protein QBC35DRAFT_395941 [Podospora australis]